MNLGSGNSLWSAGSFCLVLDKNKLKGGTFLVKSGDHTAHVFGSPLTTFLDPKAYTFAFTDFVRCPMCDLDKPVRFRIYGEKCFTEQCRSTGFVWVTVERIKIETIPDFCQLKFDLKVLNDQDLIGVNLEPDCIQNVDSNRIMSGLCIGDRVVDLARAGQSVLGTVLDIFTLYDLTPEERLNLNGSESRSRRILANKDTVTDVNRWVISESFQEELGINISTGSTSSSSFNQQLPVQEAALAASATGVDDPLQAARGEEKGCSSRRGSSSSNSRSKRIEESESDESSSDFEENGSSKHAIGGRGGSGGGGGGGTVSGGGDGGGVIEHGGFGLAYNTANVGTVFRNYTAILPAESEDRFSLPKHSIFASTLSVNAALQSREGSNVPNEESGRRKRAKTAEQSKRDTDERNACFFIRVNYDGSDEIVQYDAKLAFGFHLIPVGLNVHLIIPSYNHATNFSLFHLRRCLQTHHSIMGLKELMTATNQKLKKLQKASVKREEVKQLQKDRILVL